MSAALRQEGGAILKILIPSGMKLLIAMGNHFSLAYMKLCYH